MNDALAYIVSEEAFPLHSLAREDEEEQEEEAEEKSCSCAKSVRASDLWTKADTGDLVDDDLLEGWAAGVSKVMREQAREIAAAIRREPVPTRQTVDAAMKLLRESKWNAELVQAMQPYMSRALRFGAELGKSTVMQIAKSRVVAEIGWTSDELKEYVERASVRLSSDIAGGVNDTTEVRLRDLIGDGIEKGEDSRQLATRIEDWIDESDEDDETIRNRARTIARTEAARASSTAEQDAWRSTGIVKGKTWLLAPDPCPFCEAAAEEFGTQAVDLDEPFYRKGDVLTAGDKSITLDYSDVNGPPLHPNCRCATQPELVDDYQDIAEEAVRRIRGEKPRKIEA
jgi:hypothetical protein